MNEKRNAMLTIGILFAIILVFSVADYLNTDKTFSVSENRTLAARPDFSVDDLVYGDYIGAYETYTADQFVSREKWMEIRTRLDFWLQKKEINGVYLGKDDYLIQVHNPTDYTETQEKSRIASLKKIVNKWDALVMLVPSADNILTDKLPAYSTYYDEKPFWIKSEKRSAKNITWMCTPLWQSMRRKRFITAPIPTGPALVPDMV